MTAPPMFNHRPVPPSPIKGYLDVEFFNIQRTNPGVFTAPGGIPRTANAKMAEHISVKDFGAIGNDVADDTAALERAAAYVRTLAVPIALEFPSGTYRYTVSPDWRIADLTLLALGHVVLHFTGTGVGVRFGADATATNVTNVRMLGDFYLTGTASTTTGLFTRNLHHARIELEAANCVTAFTVQGSVLSEFALICSVNRRVMDLVPTTGLIVDRSATITYTTDCTFDLILEGIAGIGVHGLYSVSNTFRGTSEGNTGGSGVGVILDAPCDLNVFTAFFCEMNAAGDFDIAGMGTLFVNCVGSSVAGVKGLTVRSTGVRNKWIGGYFVEATIESSAADTYLLGYDGTTVNDSGTRTWNQGLGNQTQIPILGPFATATYLGAWSNTSGTYPALAYARNWSSGEVMLKGEAGGGVSGTAIMQLPAGLSLRPTLTRTFVASATGSQDYAVIDVDPSGNVTHRFGATASISLEGVRFVP